jgi:RNA 3'-terminal phosphate cyclase (ATP)
MFDLLVIDGSQGEGGGQILRTSLSLAAVTGRPVQLVNIRAGRSRPGLAAQHLTAARAVAAICGGQLQGQALGSQTITFTPGPLTGGAYAFDVSLESPSAGSTCLIVQALLPALLFARQDSEITLHGGTELPWSPVYQYLHEIFTPLVRSMGGDFAVNRGRAGWYPAGGGEVRIQVRPLEQPLRPLQLLARGELTSLICHSLISDRLPNHVLTRQYQACRLALGPPGRQMVAETHKTPSLSPGTTCLAMARFASGATGGYTALGARGKPAEQVGAEAGEGLRQFLRGGATVDHFLADQLLLYAALAQGESMFVAPEATNHLRTNAAVIEQLLGVVTHFETTAQGLQVRLTGVSQQPAKGEL